ncbi:uncharacterized protein LOC110681599 [Chenopodium quinoa]|uniref:uncharacterized protein LOC110681599 n=1 Tax=Chenopodium quinoa TaxID=63459 RepID=UPI000B78A2DB|nr:uncharacterized protein LOC110681599 [Chenopodium quinoa]
MTKPVFYEEEIDLEFSTTEDEAKYKKLLDVSDEKLYDGCTKFSKMSFLLHLFHIKCMSHWSAESFNMLLELLIDAFPQILEFPLSYYQSKRIIKDLGLGYEKIDACPNNCMLYWGDFSKEDKCHVCGTSRWKKNKGTNDNVRDQDKNISRSGEHAKNMLRHPSDALACKSIDQRYEDFASDPRSVLLGLASDGFNPYRLMNTTYSTWPPLVHELKLLWSGVAFDAYDGEKFKLRSALLWTINDFPGYAMLSGSKTCYCGYRKWLPSCHPYRFESDSFNGREEHGEAPPRPSGTDILGLQEKKKNVCDNTLNTLLNTDKSRDKKDDRDALQGWGIKPHLWGQDNHMPSTSYSMSVEEKERFLKFLQKLRVPNGYGSNHSRCVNMKQRINLQSHDNHVFMQDILPVALRASNATKVIDLLAKLSYFFKQLCSTAIDPDDLDALQEGIVLTLCELEMEFLPSFFTIMVHFLIHLVEEVKLGGPVQYRWMYPIERYLAHLKSHVVNKAQPEGSIEKGYLLEETIRFCSRYLEGVKTVYNKPKRIDDDSPNSGKYLCNSGGRVIGKEVNF